MLPGYAKVIQYAPQIPTLLRTSCGFTLPTRRLRGLSQRARNRR